MNVNLLRITAKNVCLQKMFACKKCLLAKKNIDNSHMLKQYKAAFPGFFRDGDILKRFWNNWKKDSTAYRQFLDSVKNK